MKRLPGAKQQELARAKRQEWATLALRLSVVAALYGVVGNSQALSAIWLKSLWALWPPAAFLVAVALERRPTGRRFPFGFYRAVSIGFMTSALSLVAMGVYLLVAGLQSHVIHDPDKLPAIGQSAPWWAWPGWWVIAALAYSLLVPGVIGRRRLTHARNLHDKGLYADASMGKVNALAAATAMAGVVGIGLGAPALDIVATLVIGAGIFIQGLRHLYTAVCDLMDEMPRTLGTNQLDPLAETIRCHLKAAPGVAAAYVRLREEGRMLTGIGQVELDAATADLYDLARLRDTILTLDWRLIDFQIAPSVTRTNGPADAD